MMLTDSAYHITCIKLIKPVLAVYTLILSDRLLVLFLGLLKWLELIRLDILDLARLGQQSWVFTTFIELTDGFRT